MAYKRKTRDEYHVVVDYGDGWEVVHTETTYREIRIRLREYWENQPQYPTTWVKKRVPIEGVQGE